MRNKQAQHTMQSTLTLLCVALLIATSGVSAQTELFELNSKYGLTLSYSNDLSNDMVRFTGTIKYGPVRLFPFSRRIIHCVKHHEQSECSCVERVHPDSVQSFLKNWNETTNSLPEIVDSVYKKYPVSLTTVVGYSYIYNAPLSNSMLKGTIGMGGIYGGLIATLNTGVIADLFYHDTTCATWTEHSSVEFRPYVGIAFTFTNEGEHSIQLDSSTIEDFPDTASSVTTLKVPGTVAAELLAGFALTFSSRVSLLFGFSLNHIVVDGATIEHKDSGVEETVNAELQRESLRFSEISLDRISASLGISINLN